MAQMASARFRQRNFSAACVVRKKRHGMKITAAPSPIGTKNRPGPEPRERFRQGRRLKFALR